MRVVKVWQRRCRSALLLRVEFALLGPLEVALDGRAVGLGGVKQRALLAMLLLHANEVVLRDRLIDGLWGEDAPAGARRTLDSYVSRLRTALGADRVLRRDPGYLIRVEPGELDLDRFGLLVDEARRLSASNDIKGSVSTLRDADRLWRGHALADLLYEPFAGDYSRQLEERRQLAREQRIDAELAIGEGADLVPELEALVAKHPYRERPLGQLMLALYRGGRTAEALAAYQAGRRRLADELGLEPGAQLRQLEKEILDQDRRLTSAPGPFREASPFREGSPKRLSAMRRLLITVVGVSAVGIAAVITVMATRTPSGAPRASSSIAQAASLDGMSGVLRDAVSLPGTPAASAADKDSLWLADPDTGTVVRLDRISHTVRQQITVGGSPSAIATGGGFVWVARVPGDTVTRIDPKTNTVTQAIPLGGARASALAFGNGGLWVADTVDDSLLELDPVTGAVRRTITLRAQPTALALANRAIWVADYEANSVTEVDLRTGQALATTHVGNGPTALAVGAGGAWVANSLDSTVSKIDSATGSVTATIPVGSGPDSLAVSQGSIWVANRYSATISKIDPSRNLVTSTITVGGGATTVSAAGGMVWAGTRPLERHKGGTLRLLAHTPFPIDPALNEYVRPLQADGLTGDGLVTYDHVSGPQGLQLVPDLAVAIPAAAESGNTYTFRLRPGIRYSDGRRLKAADFRRGIERLFRVSSWATDLFLGILGATDCNKPGARVCNLSRGIVTDDASRTVSFHLAAPDPNFLRTLAEGGIAFPVPAGAPLHPIDSTPIPGTGPYRIATASNTMIHYVRNPFFHEWSHAAQPDGNPDEIVWRLGMPVGAEVRAIENGTADWSADPIPAQLLGEVKTRFAGQYHVFGANETDWFQFNTTLPPFDDVRARQALNFAIDRRQVVLLDGGLGVATPTCQILPPGFPGYTPYCPYTLKPTSRGRYRAPDLQRARRLVTASGTRGSRVTVWGWTDDPGLTPRLVGYVATVLRRLGYRATTRLVSHAFLAHPPAPVFAGIQLAPTAWGDLSEYGFFAPWLTCAGSGDHGWFCDHALDRKIASAEKLEATDARAASRAWAAIDREVVDRAAWVPLVNPRQSDFVSTRVGNYQYQPWGGLVADQLWLK